MNDDTKICLDCANHDTWGGGCRTSNNRSACRYYTPPRNTAGDVNLETGDVDTMDTASPPITQAAAAASFAPHRTAASGRGSLSERERKITRNYSPAERAIAAAMWLVFGNRSAHRTPA